MTQHVSYQKIGKTRERARLWMEGEKLKAAGFVRDARYDITTTPQGLLLRLDPKGSHKVSGKVRDGADMPIIDIKPSHPDIDFSPEARIRALFRAGTILISLHHEAQARIHRERAFRANLEKGTLREASMFTGGGISTHAIHTAIADFGLRPDLAWVVDVDGPYLDSAARNTHAITNSTAMIVGRAEEIEPLFFQQVDVFSFSMPCSSFSKAGKAKHGQTSEEHEGGTALFGTMAAIKAANPAVLISENVVEARNAPAYLLLKSELVRLGYAIFERTMNSADTGTVENRNRYWFIALSEGLAEGFDFSLIHAGALLPRPTINSLLDAEVDPKLWFDPAYFDEKARTDAAAGKNFKRQVMTGEETSVGVLGRHYNKRRSTEAFLKGAVGMERLFTPTEHARLKSAPEHLIAGLGRVRAHEILGQSVDWRQACLAMGSVMAHALRRLVPTLAPAPQ